MAKLPQVLNNDDGAYVCMVYPRGNSSSRLFAFNVDVTVSGKADWKKTSRAEALRARMHLLLLLLMVQVGINARNSSNSIIYLEVL